MIFFNKWTTYLVHSKQLTCDIVTKIHTISKLQNDRPKEYETYSGSHSRRFEATLCIRLRNAGKNKTVNEVNSIQKGGFEFQSTIYTISCKCDDCFANLDNMYNTAAFVRGPQELSNLQGCRNFGAWGVVYCKEWGCTLWGALHPIFL